MPWRKYVMTDTMMKMVPGKYKGWKLEVIPEPKMFSNDILHALNHPAIGSEFSLVKMSSKPTRT